MNWALASLLIAAGLALLLVLGRCRARRALRVISLSPPQLSEEDKQSGCRGWVL